jgi:hypothetical protein
VSFVKTDQLDLDERVHLGNMNLGTFTAWCGWKADSEEEQRNWIYGNKTRDYPGIRMIVGDWIHQVTCHACLEAVVRHGDAATARLLELDRDAAREESGGTCAHSSVFQCTWCDEHFCLSRECRTRVPNHRGEIKTIAKQCRDCEKIEQALEERAWPLRDRGGQHVGTPAGVLITHTPSGLAAFHDGERSQWQNRREARKKLRDALRARPPT